MRRTSSKKKQYSSPILCLRQIGVALETYIHATLFERGRADSFIFFIAAERALYLEVVLHTFQRDSENADCARGLLTSFAGSDRKILVYFVTTQWANSDILFEYSAQYFHLRQLVNTQVNDKTIVAIGWKNENKSSLLCDTRLIAISEVAVRVIVALHEEHQLVGRWNTHSLENKVALFCRQSADVLEVHLRDAVGICLHACCCYYGWLFSC